MTVLVALEERLPDLSGVDRWLYAGEDAAWRIAAERGVLAGVRRVSTADLLQRKGEELRRPFLDWVGELGARNDSLEWWASQLAARSSYSGFYDRICALAAVLETLAQEPGGSTLVVCSSPALAAEVARAAGVPTPSPGASDARGASGRRLLRAWTRLAPRPLHGLPGRASESVRLLLDGDPRFRRRILAEQGLLNARPFGGPGTALLFTWIDGRSFTADGRYTDPHLGPLPRLLRERGVEVAYVPRVLSGLRFEEAVTKLAATGETFLFPDAYLELDDHRDCARRAAAFAPELADDASVAGVPVAALAREHLDEQRPAQAQALLLEPLLRRFAAHGVRPARIVHTCEGHGWELVLARAAQQQLPRTVVIGYDNLNMSRLALSMFPARAELGVRPLPHRIVTNGPAYRDVLVAEGVPADSVRVGCALRHEGLWSLPPRTGRPRRPLLVAAATEIALGPSVELVQKAAAAFAGLSEVELVVKPHPVLSRARLLQALATDERGLHFAEDLLLELLQRADVLLYTYSVVGLEALALGVPPVFVRSESTLDLDQLEFAADVRWTARTPTELRNRVEAIAAEDLDAWRPRARAAAMRALAPLRPECVEAFL